MFEKDGAVMAVLFDMCNEKYIELNLNLTNEVDWLSYKMIVGEISSSERKELFRLEGEELFLHNSYEKEVEILIENLNQIKKNKCFRFSPKDDGEFELAVKYSRKNEIIVTLTINCTDGMDLIKFLTNKFELKTTDRLLEDFILELNKEYSMLNHLPSSI